MSNEVDFFVAGGTLRTSAPSYVTRPADAELLQHLQAGEFCYVLTPRQMGKSSLMVRTAQRLRSEGVRVAIIDLTSIGASSSAISADQWYLGLLSRIRSELRLITEVQAWWQAHSAFSVAQRFTDFLQQVVLTECANKVVILIDEIDSTLTLPFRDDFFAAIRAIYNERAHNPIYSRLTFALFGVATPTDLIQDRERTPFNIGHRIDLREFTLTDAEPLRQGLAHQLPEQADAIFQRIFYWTNGHPYLTQKLCQAIALYTTAWQEARVDQAVDQLVNTAFLSEEGRKDPNLTFVQDRIVTSPKTEQRQMLRLYLRVWRSEQVADDNHSLIQNRLELYGLVGVVQGTLQVRNQIYKQVFTPAWVDSVMPTNRRQRNAWLAATIALLLVVGISAFLLLQPDSTCSELQAQFEANATNSSIQLSALAGLFDRVDTCGSMAFDLFYGLVPENQIALFVGLSNPVSERTQVVTVIEGVYRTLDTVPAHDQELMKGWLTILQSVGLTENDPLIASISYWKEGRQAFQEDKFEQAAVDYNYAITAVSDMNHPVLHYDLALTLLKTREYSKALLELDEVVRIAETISIPATLTPSPSPTLTSTLSPIESTESTAVTNTTVLPIMTPITVSKSLSITYTPTETTSETVTPIQEKALYQRRFRDADSIKRTVKVLLEESSEALAYYQENRKRYPHLAELDILLLVPTNVPDLPTQIPTSAPTSTLTSTATVTPTPTQTLAISPCQSVSYATRLRKGIRAYVAVTPPLANVVRINPAITATAISSIQPGVSMTILDGPECTNGWFWWYVQPDSGPAGWTSEGQRNEYWLVPGELPTATPVVPGPAPTVIETNFSGEWYTNFAKMTLTQSSNAVIGSYTRYSRSKAISLHGTVSGRTLTGIIDKTNIKFTLVLGDTGQSFDGEWIGLDGRAYPWCGVRNGPLPSGCGFSGLWSTNFGVGGWVDLQQVGSTVNGRYYNGSAEGILEGNFEFVGPDEDYSVSGTYSVKGRSGFFRFNLLNLQSEQFQGCWRDQTTEENDDWCGWHSNSSQPTQCSPQPAGVCN